MLKRILPAALLLTAAGMATFFIFPERDARLLTPLAFGGILIPLSFMTRNADFKHIAAHGAAITGLLGFVFNVQAWAVLWKGAKNDVEWHAAMMKSLTAVILLVLLIVLVFGMRSERLSSEKKE